MDRRTLVKGFAAGLLGTAAVAGAGTGFEVATGVNTAASAAEIGSKQSPVAVVGAGGECHGAIRQPPMYVFYLAFVFQYYSDIYYST